jgi:anaerobic ribonucleoside-triphosphate reductase activating protein
MNYHKIEKTSIANGDGVRVVLWASGCSLHCKGCHNPQTWDCSSGKLFDESAKQELFEALSKPWIQGITFSGGHPLEDSNVECILSLIHEVKDKFPNKDIWLYTGLTLESIYPAVVLDELSTYDTCRQLIVKNCDVVVDGPFIESQKDLTLKWRGSSNQRVIDIQQSLQQNKIILYKGDN